MLVSNKTAVDAMAIRAKSWSKTQMSSYEMYEPQDQVIKCLPKKNKWNSTSGAGAEIEDR